MKWTCKIPGKADTDWAGGLYPLSIIFSEDYPTKPPLVGASCVQEYTACLAHLHCSLAWRLYKTSSYCRCQHSANVVSGPRPALAAASRLAVCTACKDEASVDPKSGLQDTSANITVQSASEPTIMMCLSFLQCKFPAGFFHPNVYPSGQVCLSIINEVNIYVLAVLITQKVSCTQ